MKSMFFIIALFIYTNNSFGISASADHLCTFYYSGLLKAFSGKKTVNTLKDGTKTTTRIHPSNKDSYLTIIESINKIEVTHNFSEDLKNTISKDRKVTLSFDRKSCLPIGYQSTSYLAKNSKVSLVADINLDIDKCSKIREFLASSDKCNKEFNYSGIVTFDKNIKKIDEQAQQEIPVILFEECVTNSLHFKTHLEGRNEEVLKTLTDSNKQAK